jgi:polar amino acid transport system substrate-binding protein
MNTPAASAPSFVLRIRRLVAVGIAGATMAACGGVSARLDDKVVGQPVEVETPPALSLPPCPDPESDPTRSFAPPASLPSPGSMPAGSTMAAIAERGTLRVGVSADTLTFGARNPITGDIEGFDIDMLKLVAQAIFGDSDNRLDFKVITYGQRLPSLIAGDVDIVAHTMTINCPRWQAIAFSSTYFLSSTKVLTRTDNDSSSLAELVANGNTICAPKASTNIEFLNKNFPDAQTVEVNDITDCLVSFQQSKADAIISDDTVLAGFTLQDPYAKILDERLSPEPYGLGINLEQRDFVSFVNGVLEDARRDGSWQRLYDARLAAPLGPATPPEAVYGR